MINEIYTRRSIRNYTDTDISRETIIKILEAGIQAPSAKNRQPWHYIVVKGTEKKRMLLAMKHGVEKEESGNGIFGESPKHLAGAKYTIQIMEQAPAIIFILDRQGHSVYEALSVEERIYERANIQSISASIQNMILEAQSHGIGSLWICDIYFAYYDLQEWLNTEGEMMAALALGYAAEQPYPRPRKQLCDVTQWRE